MANNVYQSQYARRALVADSLSGTASFAATASYINPIRLDPIEDPNPTGLLYPTSTYLYQSSSNTSLGYDLYIRQDGNVVKWKWVEGMMNTGLLYGGVVTYSGDEVYISSGSGIIVDHNAVTGSEIGPIVDYVTWGPITQSVENISTQQVTYLYIDPSGNLQQQNSRFTFQQYHNYIPLGAVGHFDYTQVSAFGGAVQTAYDQTSQILTFVDAFGPLKVSGYGISGQAGSLRLDIGSGTSFIHGGFYENDPEFPSTLNTPTQLTASIAYVYKSGSGVYFDTNNNNFYTVIDPTKWDDGSGVLQTVPGGSYTNQRVYIDPKTGILYIYYGTETYNSIDTAIQGLLTDDFTEGDTFDFTTYLGILVVKGNVTDITNISDAQILPSGLFRAGGTGGGGGGGSTLPGGQDTQIQFNNMGVFDGEPEFTYNYTDSIVTLTGSMLVSGAISASFGLNTVGFFGTASWAQNASFAQTASFITASNVWGPFGSSSVQSASYASGSTSASYALTSSFAATASAAPLDTYIQYNKDGLLGATSSFRYIYTSNSLQHGYQTVASGRYSHAAGNGTEASGIYSYAGGIYTIASGSSQTVIGQYNVASTSQSAFIVGDGYFDGFSTIRHNVLFVSKSYFEVSASKVYLQGLPQNASNFVLTYDTSSGQVYYLDSSSLGGGTADIAISSSGTGLTATVESINFTGGGVVTTTSGNDVTVTIPGGAGVAGGANTQIQFNSGSSFSGSGNFSFDYVNNIVYLTGSSLTSGSITLTGSMFVSGAISASFGPNTVGFYGTASWAQNALTASFITASNVYGPFGSSSINSASYASSSTSASYAETASLAFTASFITGAGVFGPFGSNSVLSASYASGSTSASYALTASFALASNPAPSDTHVQYNNNGAFGASSNFIFDYTNNFVQIKGRLKQANGDATGTGAHAEGNKTTAKGDYSHAEGDTTSAEGEGSHAAGLASQALGKYQSVIGQYNVANTSQSAFIIGDGVDGSNRHNLLFASQSWFEVSASNVFLKGLTNTAKTNVITIDTTTGQLFYTASNTIGGGGGSPTPPATPLNSIQFNTASAFGGSAALTFISASSTVILTGSLITSGSTQTVGTASIDGIALIGTSSAYALYTTAKITTVSDINTIYSLQTASYDGAFFDYTLISGLNARAGQIMSIWSGSDIRYTETTTTDIGSTSEFIFSVALTAGSASLQVTGSTGAIIKTIIKGI